MKMSEEYIVPKKIKDTMLMLGCVEMTSGIFRHPDFAFDFDLSAIHPDKVLQRMWVIFSSKGYEKAQEDFRHLIGIE